MLGWNNSREKQEIEPLPDQPLISVIIPARNEGENIGQLLQDMQQQTYENFELIVINDNSIDNTREVVRSSAQADPRVVLVDCQGEGKKKALTTGIQMSKGKIIVTTDADCRVGKGWLKALIKYFKQEKIVMVFGGVKIEQTSFFSQVQSIEFLSLVGTAASTLSWGIPTMCNGANLAFRKSVFTEVDGYENNFHIASGDDEFLMHKISHVYPEGIQFASDADSVVETAASKNLKEFIYQRVRWAGKWRHNLSTLNITLAVFIFSFQLSLLLLPIALLFQWIDLQLTLLLLSTKIILEWIFLKKVSKFLSVVWSPGAFFLLQFFYPVYTVSIGLMSTFIPFKWKGRKLKSFTLSPTTRC